MGSVLKKLHQDSESVHDEVYYPQMISEDGFSDYLARRKTLNTPTELEFRLSCATEFAITHFENDVYWGREPCETSPYGIVAVLKSVCWLELSATSPNIPNGRYLVYWKIKLDSFNFNGVWKAGVNSRVHNQSGHEEVAEGDHEVSISTDSHKLMFHKSVGKGWQSLILGIICVRENSPVNFHFLGGNPYWCHGVSYDYVGLIRLVVDYSVVRVLLLAATKERQLENENCKMSKLFPELIRQIVSYL